MADLTTRQKEVYDAYHSLSCSVSAVSSKLHLDTKAIHSHLFRCAKKGWPVTPDNYCPQAPAGFALDKTTIQINKDGDVIQRWDRASPHKQDSIDQIINYLAQRTPTSDIKFHTPFSPNKNLMLEWLLFDHHLSMHAWAKQTGAAYNTDIAKSLMIGAAKQIFSRCGPVKEIVIVLGGDNMHSDNRSATTEKAKHHLDVDTRYQRSLEAMMEGTVSAIELALPRADKVTVEVLSGNHDYHSAIALSLILKSHYRNIPEVFIDDSPAKHKFFRWGGNFFMYTHGDTGNPQRLSGFLLNHIVDNDITGIRNKHVRRGHLHKPGKVVIPAIVEDNGVVIENFTTLAAADAYTHEQAYSQIRATTYALWHHQYGRRGGGEVCVGELVDAA